MSPGPDDHEHEPAAPGARTPAEGTPVPVDVSRDVRARATWVVLLGGPVIWFGHFMTVYLVAEAGCTGGGAGLQSFDPPVPAVVSAVATALAVAGCLVVAQRGHRRWRVDAPGGAGERVDAAHELERHRTLGLVGLLLSLLSAVAVLFVAVPVLVFPSC